MTIASNLMEIYKEDSTCEFSKIIQELQTNYKDFNTRTFTFKDGSQIKRINEGSSIVKYEEIK